MPWCVSTVSLPASTVPQTLHGATRPAACLQVCHPITKEYDSKDLTNHLESYCFAKCAGKPNGVYIFQKQVGGVLHPPLQYPRYNCPAPAGLVLPCGKRTSSPSAVKGSVIYLASLARFASKEAASCVQQ